MEIPSSLIRSMDLITTTNRHIYRRNDQLREEITFVAAAFLLSDIILGCYGDTDAVARYAEALRPKIEFCRRLRSKWNWTELNLAQSSTSLKRDLPNTGSGSSRPWYSRGQIAEINAGPDRYHVDGPRPLTLAVDVEQYLRDSDMIPDVSWNSIRNRYEITSTEAPSCQIKHLKIFNIHRRQGREGEASRLPSSRIRETFPNLRFRKLSLRIADHFGRAPKCSACPPLPKPRQCLSCIQTLRFGGIPSCSACPWIPKMSGCRYCGRVPSPSAH